MSDLQLASHLRNALVRVHNSCTCGLCTIHRRTAAECDNTLTAVLEVKSAGFLNIFNRRVRLNSVINRVLDSLSVKLLKKTCKQVETHKALIRNNKNA